MVLADDAARCPHIQKRGKTGLLEQCAQGALIGGRQAIEGILQA